MQPTERDPLPDTADLPTDSRLPAGLVGRTLGGYRLVARLGRGGMGELYRGHDPVLQRDFAIKVLGAGGVADPELRGRFLREARLAARIDHPNVVPVVKYGEEGDVAYAVMPLVEGEDLAARIARLPAPLPRDELLSIATQAARGLAEIHRAGIVHRDVKPGNLLIDGSGRVRVIDLGLAREASSAPGLTSAGRIFGTPHFMAPEQARGESTDARTDVYAFGLTLFQLATGRVPFDGDSLLDVLNRQVQEDLPDPGRFNPEVRGEFAALLAWMTAKAPDRRPASMDEVVRRLEAIAAARPAPSPMAGTRRALGRAAAAGALVVAALVGILAGARSLGEGEADPGPEPEVEPAEEEAPLGRRTERGGDRAGEAWKRTIEFRTDDDLRSLLPEATGYALAVADGRLVARRESDEAYAVISPARSTSPPLEFEVEFEGRPAGESSLSLQYPARDGFYAAIVSSGHGLFLRRDGETSAELGESPLDRPLRAGSRYRLRVRAGDDGRHEIALLDDQGEVARIGIEADPPGPGPVFLQWDSFQELVIHAIRER